MKLLRPLEGVYHLLSGLKNKLYDTGLLHPEQVSVPVVSVGNLSFGGVGKTPCIMLLAREFSTSMKVSIVVKSYKTALDRSEKVNLHLKDAVKRYGDEACLLQSSLVGCTVWSGPVKLESAEAAAVDRPSLILIDDGFSHRKLKRNFDLVLLDASCGFNTYLRESRSNLSRASAVLLTKVNLVSAEKLREFESDITLNAPSLKGKIFRSTVRTEVPAAGKAVLFLFCGIGNPDSLIRDLEQQGHRIVNKIIFTDHHKFTVADEKCILDEFLKTGDSLLVCTAKDYVKLTSDELKKRAKVLTHSIEIEHKGELLAQIRHSL